MAQQMSSRAHAIEALETPDGSDNERYWICATLQPAISDKDWGLLSRSSNVNSSPHAHLRCKVPASQRANPSGVQIRTSSNAAIRPAPAFAIERWRRVQLGELHTKNVDCSRPVSVFGKRASTATPLCSRPIAFYLCKCFLLSSHCPKIRRPNHQTCDTH